jgi:uncharacterized membrane protein
MGIDQRESASTAQGLEEIRRAKGLDRILNLSDGIFAFAITLLALDLVTPVILGQPSDAKMFAALAGEFHSFLGFLVSFWVISMLWLSHNRIFRYIRYSDPGLFVLDLLILFFVVMVPFATRVLNYGLLPVAVDVYALIQIGALLTTSVIWRYASRADRHLLGGEVSRKVSDWLANRGFLAAAVFTLSIFLAFISPYLSVAAWLSVLPGLVILDRRSLSEKEDHHTQVAPKLEK